MAYRIYDSKALDFQIAPCFTGNTNVAVLAATGSPYVAKSQVANVLSKYVDAKTFAAIPERFMPLSLRWRVSPELGMPYTPFKVYKRKKQLAFAETTAIAFPFGSNTMFMNGPFWQISCTFKNPLAFPVAISVSPVDQYQELIPNLKYDQTIPANSAVNVRFKFPNINGLVFTSGSATLQTVTGIRMNDFLNDAGWELVETVGLPYKNGTPDPVAYQNSLQGFPAAPVDGDMAAVNRTAIARVFYQNPVFVQADGTTLPTWQPPDPAALVQSLLKKQATLDGTNTGIVYDIEEMLTRVHKNPALYNGKQVNFLKQYVTKGFSDDGTTTSDNATIKNPVCSTSLLGVATDCWNALGLGYGTTDFANIGGYTDQKFQQGNSEYNIECDYLLTASFRVPQYGIGIKDGLPVIKFDHFDTYEIATLAHAAGALPVVTGLNNEVFAENRPLQRDASFSDDVKLYWKKSTAGMPTGYAVAIHDLLTGQLGYLNTDRPFLPGFKRPYIPATRADGDAQDLQGSDSDSFDKFFHHRSPRPETGNATKDYYVAAMDVFGRWSAFQKTESILPAAPLINADIISGKFVIDTNGVTEKTPHIYKNNTTLELIVAWHWDDRSPSEIVIGGHFVNVPAPPATIDTNAIPKNAGVTLDNTLVSAINISIAFKNDVPYVKDMATGVAPDYKAPATEAEVVIDTVNSAAPNTIAYKIRIKKVSLNFESKSKLGFAAYVRSSEKNTPALYTAYGQVKMIYANDPIPRPAPPILPNVNWSSLPDANNVSRYRVSFSPPAATNVVGYAIYRASEADLRRKLGLAPTENGSDILARNITLKALSDAQKNMAKDVFIRINTQMLQVPQIDVDLPGDLEGMYIYAMTSFTDQRMESNFSDWLYVAVPHRFAPPAPSVKVLVHKDKDPDHPEIITQQRVVLKVEIPKGVKTEMLDVFQTQKDYLAASIDLMGLPVMEGGLKGMPAGWEAFDDNDTKINTVTVDTAVAYYNITQTVAASWFPVYYRVAGFGTHDEPAGKFPGRSKSSNLAMALLSPPTDFQLKNGTLASFNTSLLRIDFFTDAEIHATSYGNFKLTIQKRNTATNLYEDVLARDMTTIAKKQPADVAAKDALFRLAKDATGCFEYEYYVQIEDEAWYKVIVTDPLGRRKSLDLHYKKPVVATSSVVIKNLVLKQLLLSVEMSFQVNVTTKHPPTGHYLLEILATTAIPVITPVINPHILTPIKINPRTKVVTLYSGNMDAIGTTIPAANPAVYRDALMTRDGFATYHAVFKGTGSVSTLNNATIVIRVTDPDGKQTQVSGTLKGGIIKPL